MLTPRRFAILVALLGASLMSVGCVSGPTDAAVDDKLAIAAVYRGPAACEGCPEAAASVLEKSGRFNVQFIGPGEERALDDEGLAMVTLYVQPGGHDDVDLAMEQLGESATDAISRWVRDDGGRYLGLCMGAYLAGSDPGMGLLAPGDTLRYAGTPDSLVDDGQESVIAVEWDGEIRYQYSQDPAVIVESGVEGERVLSRFANGAVNALVRPVGEGAVGVVGTHPEATRDWFSPELKKRDIDGLDHDRALQLVVVLMQLR